MKKRFFNKLSFIINFNINKTNNDFTNINVRDKNLKFNFIESIKFDIENNVLPQLNPFQNNIAYYNNLIFNFNFFNLKQNEFLYKVLEQKIEIKTPNRYYTPARNYNINFLNKILIKENNKDYSFDLIPKINTVNKFKTNIEYFIDKNNRWDNNQKEFFESKNGILKGYHLPLKYSGDITLKFNLNQKLVNNLKEIKYLANFSHPLFNENNGLIKLNCQVINTTEEFQNLNYSDWTLKNL
ncbi:MHO_1580 family protein [Mycoplasmopsis arginini]|uniref:MHO_1580 family protein n=1 Tax=Mycoplasmopsis arginini TaxID=2094 RepID=UPI003D0357C7